MNIILYSSPGQNLIRTIHKIFNKLTNIIFYLVPPRGMPSTTLKWVLLYLTLTRRSRTVIGDNKCSIEDIPRLPYT